MTITKKIETWIKAQIKDLPPGSRLPKDAELAKLFKCSKITISRKLKKLEKDGLIERIWGVGTQTPSINEKLPSLNQLHEKRKSLSHAYRNLTEQLLAEISEGKIKQGEMFPPAKHYTYQYKISLARVRLSFKELERKRLVHKVGHNYFLGEMIESKQMGEQKELYLFSPKNFDLAKLYRDDLYAPSFRKFEEILLSFNYKILYCYLENLSLMVNQWKKNESFPAGILLLGSITGRLNQHQVNKVIPELTVFDKQSKLIRPKVIMLTRGRITPPFSWSYCLNPGQASNLVVRLLARKAMEWKFSKIRILVDHSHDKFNGVLDFMRFVAEYFRLLDSAHVECHIFHAEQTKNNYLKQLTERYQNKYLESLLSKYRELNFNWKAKIYIHVVFKNFAKKIAINVEPKFQKELWVCPSHKMAAKALYHCKENNLKVPERISIVTLQEDASYFHENISSFTRDFDTTGYLMAHSIIGDIPISKTSHGYLKTAARCLLRGTTP